MRAEHSSPRNVFVFLDGQLLPLLPHLRHHHHGLRRRKVRPRDPRLHTAPLCHHRGGGQRPGLRPGRLPPQLAHRPPRRHRPHAPDPAAYAGHLRPQEKQGGVRGLSGKHYYPANLSFFSSFFCRKRKRKRLLRKKLRFFLRPQGGKTGKRRKLKRPVQKDFDKSFRCMV